MAVPSLTVARNDFHTAIRDSILTVNANGVPGNADKGSKPSIEIAKEVLTLLGSWKTSEKLPGQTAGSDFEEICTNFVRVCFAHLTHLRPGEFFVEKGGSIAAFDQYAHLDKLKALASSNRDIATAIGADYLIKPDIVVGRHPASDTVINGDRPVVDKQVARLTSLRKLNQDQPILHASISCKWTLRSDRAQNARSEGLNLVRNRKGRLPHIAIITGEPLPGRIASLALGTGDIDCVYHFALPELRKAIINQKREETLEILDMMVEGKRLKDIADLPLDLVI